MSSFAIALIMAAGVAAWVYSKVSDRTGGNTQNAIVVTSVTAVIVFVITLTILSLIDSIL